MTAAMERDQPKPHYGNAKPRVAPPMPAKSLYKDYVSTAEAIGTPLIPWQVTAGRYLYATAPNGNWLYPEVAEVASRQNGKTEPLVPHIVKRLEMGRRVMHTAQNRELPRHVFNRVATVMEARHGLRVKVRRGAGQETIEMPGDRGLYRIVAPNRAGARGGSNDDLIVDEVREFSDQEFMAAAGPTLAASTNPQTLYLSNAGEEDSIVLNALRLRATEDPTLAYLEWSAAPDRSTDDRDGWFESNPALGHFPGMLTYLERVYKSHVLAGTLAIFETEHLCRWVKTTREQFVDGPTWMACQGPVDSVPVRPSIGVAVAPDGARASVAMAWRQGDDIALRLLFNVRGVADDFDRFGKDVVDAARKIGAVSIGFDPLTDAALARLFRRPKPESITGGKYANASAQFVNLVNANRLRWQNAEAVTEDLVWTSRKYDRESGTFEAVRASETHSITASLAAIRAVWLASAAAPPAPKVM